MITDADDNEITYWPISGLVEGEHTDPAIINVTVPLGPSALRATRDERISVWVQKTTGPHNPLIDIVAEPYWLGRFVEGSVVQFSLYVEARVPIVGLERVPLSVSTGSSGYAGWFYPAVQSIARPII